MADEETLPPPTPSTPRPTTTMESAVVASLRNRGASICVSEENVIDFNGHYIEGQDIAVLVSTLKTLTTTAAAVAAASDTTTEIVIINKLRLFNLRFEVFDPLVLEALNDLLSSRIWDRIVIVYCCGGFLTKVVDHRCRRLELYSGVRDWDVAPAAPAAPATTAVHPETVAPSAAATPTLSSMVVVEEANNHSQAAIPTTTTTSTSATTTATTTTTTTTTTIWQALGRTLQNPDSLLRILRIRSRFRHDTMAALVTGLGTPHCPLEELHFTRCADDGCMTALTRGLQHNHQLKRLTFYGCRFQNESGLERLVLEALATHPTLRALEFQDNTCFAMAAIVSLIQTTKTLQELNLYIRAPHHRQDYISVQGAFPPPRIDTESLAMALQTNTSLKHLALSKNALNDEAAAWLAKALRVNTTLETLDLSCNFIENDGAIAFGEALPELRGLKHLYLKNNRFRGKGAYALAVGMKHNVILEKLTTFSKFTGGDTIQFYCHLNQAGRRILRHGDANAVPASLWPHILNRVNHHFSDTWGGGEQGGGGEGSGGGGGVGETSSVIYSLLVEGGHEQIFGQ
jgi:hypothetical protein